MPQMANITVKKADGTTDVVYTALTPSSGDRVAAFWRNTSTAAIAACCPTLSISSRSSADRLARIVDGEFVFPEFYTDSTTGITSVRLRESFKFTRILRLDANGISAEAAAQIGNLLDSSLIQEVLNTGYAPT